MTSSKEGLLIRRIGRSVCAVTETASAVVCGRLVTMASEEALIIAAAAVGSTGGVVMISEEALAASVVSLV